MAKDHRERFLSSLSRLCRHLSARDERADGLWVRRASSEARGLTRQQVCGEKQNCRRGGVVRVLGWRLPRAAAVEGTGHSGQGLRREVPSGHRRRHHSQDSRGS